jgi:hypothetical protein
MKIIVIVVWGQPAILGALFIQTYVLMAERPQGEDGCEEAEEGCDEASTAAFQHYTLPVSLNADIDGSRCLTDR